MLCGAICRCSWETMWLRGHNNRHLIFPPKNVFSPRRSFPPPNRAKILFRCFFRENSWRLHLIWHIFRKGGKKNIFILLFLFFGVSIFPELKGGNKIYGPNHLGREKNLLWSISSSSSSKLKNSTAAAMLGWALGRPKERRQKFAKDAK